MTLGYQVDRTIDAPPERIWAVLTDADAVTGGGLGVLRIEGDMRRGARLKIWSEIAPDRAFPVTVTAFDAPRLMVWEGGMPLGLFKGVRRFELAPAPGGGARFDMTERFSGLLSGPISRTIPDLTPSFEKFADGLKRLSEGGAG
ncbi:MAG: SRPBCC domain-containing protein [Pseudomonadota bacterium]